MQLASEVASHTRFVIWNDRKLVIIYTNDLNCTPSTDIFDGSSDEAIFCVHGLCSVERWNGDEVFHRTTFQVPAPVAACNIFMNGVDRMDQPRSTAHTWKVLKRLHRSIFTWIRDFSAHNAFKIYETLRVVDKSLPCIGFQEFKRHIAEQLVHPLQAASLARRRQNMRSTRVTIRQQQRQHARQEIFREYKHLWKQRISRLWDAFCAALEKIHKRWSDMHGMRKGLLRKLFCRVPFSQCHLWKKWNFAKTKEYRRPA